MTCPIETGPVERCPSGPAVKATREVAP
jgi:hypothetical protein